MQQPQQTESALHDEREALVPGTPGTARDVGPNPVGAVADQLTVDRCVEEPSVSHVLEPTEERHGNVNPPTASILPGNAIIGEWVSGA